MYPILSGKTNANVSSTNGFQFCKQFPKEGIIAIFSSVINIFARTGPKGHRSATVSTCMYIIPP